VFLLVVEPKEIELYSPQPMSGCQVGDFKLLPNELAVTPNNDPEPVVVLEMGCSEILSPMSKRDCRSAFCVVSADEVRWSISWLRRNLDADEALNDGVDLLSLAGFGCRPAAPYLTLPVGDEREQKYNSEDGAENDDCFGLHEASRANRAVGAVELTVTAALGHREPDLHRPIGPE
jgi:hypothetical protein